MVGIKWMLTPFSFSLPCHCLPPSLCSPCVSRRGHCCVHWAFWLFDSWPQMPREGSQKKHNNAQDSRKSEMSHVFSLIQFTSCSARKLESIANQAQLVLGLTSWICVLSCNNIIDTAHLAWHRGSGECRDTWEVIGSVVSQKGMYPSFLP